MIENITVKLEEVVEFENYGKPMIYLEDAQKIVQEVAKEYGKDTNVRSNDFISRSVLLDKLQKWKFANEERGYDTASDLVQEMIDLVKEQPSAPYQKGE